jgi:3-hydroxybutyrate dehydrogenase
VIEGLNGRAALVTGSTAGLGLAIGTALAQAGCRVMLHGLAQEHEMAATCEALSQAARQDIHYTRADLSREEEVAALASAATNSLGQVDILVNSAVVRHFAPLASFPMDRWAAALAVNVTAPLQLIQLLLPAMRQAGWGRIVNMASVYGQRGTTGRVDYVTTKAAILGLTRAVAAETADEPITCNAVCPGSVSTPGTEARVEAMMTDQQIGRDQAVRQFLTGKQPSGRFVPAESVAAMVVFLCSAAGADVTGALLPVDGGWLAS